MKAYQAVLAAVALAGLPALALANISASLSQNSGATIPSGYVSTDLKITTDTDWTVENIKVTLTSGSIYYDPNDPVGDGSRPKVSGTGTNIANHPSLAWNTFVTTPGGYPNVNTANGGTAATINGAAGVYDYGQAQSLELHWYDQVTTAAGTYTVGRFTFSNNAVGTFSGESYDALQGANPTAFSGTISGGALSFGGAAAPEPASLAVLGLGVLGFLARRRRA